MLDTSYAQSITLSCPCGLNHSFLLLCALFYHTNTTWPFLIPVVAPRIHQRIRGSAMGCDRTGKCHLAMVFKARQRSSLSKQASRQKKARHAYRGPIQKHRAVDYVREVLEP